MGSVKPYVTTSGERRWEVFFRDETHRQHHKRGFETRKAARVYLAAHEVAVENGDYIDPRLSKITVGCILSTRRVPSYRGEVDRVTGRYVAGLSWLGLSGRWFLGYCMRAWVLR